MSLAPRITSPGSAFASQPVGGDHLPPGEDAVRLSQRSRSLNM